jgi:hypothetical protein
VINELRDTVSGWDGAVWVLVGLCIVTIATLQVVEAAIEGAWPHEGRISQLPAAARRGRSWWGLAAGLLLPGLVLAIANVGIMIWKDLERTEPFTVGMVLLGVGWLIFVLASAERTAVGAYLHQLGVAGPLAVTVLLVASDLLLIGTLLDIWPPLDDFREALRFT